MTRLPDALLPWTEFLGRLEPDLVASIGPWLNRLAALLGADPAHAERRSGEPDGFGGLARRGSFERLLPSQWALADWDADEFLRRAAQSELLFYEPVGRASRQTPQLVVLVDAGPDQVGAPRLAQLASLVVLARKAAERGARSAWGLVQCPGALHRDVHPQTLERGLLGRARQLGAVAAPSHLAAWAEALTPEQRDGLWLIGGVALRHLARDVVAARVCIEEPVSIDDRELRVSVRSRSAPERHLRLPLPPPEDTVRLLRDPFRLAAATPTRLAPDLGSHPALLFAPSARRLLARTGDGRLVALSVPSSPRERPGRYVVAPGPETRRLAVGWSRGRIVTVYAQGNELVLRGCQGGAVVPLPEPWRVDERERDALSPCLVYGRRHGAGLVFVHDRDLWEVTPQRQARRLATDVDGVGWSRGSLVVVERSGQQGRTLWSQRLPAGTREELRRLEPSFAGAATHLAWSTRARATREVVIGHRLSPSGPDDDTQVWSVTQGGVPGRLLRVHADAEVVGVAATTNTVDDPAAGLIVVEADRLGVRFVGESMNRRVIRTREPIVAATTATQEATVACVTEAGSLTVFSLDQRAPLLRHEPGTRHGV